MFLEDIMSSTVEMIYTNSSLAILGAFFWGLFSVIFSPCHISTVPLLLEFIVRNNKIGTNRGILLASTFALGNLMSLLVVGIITGILGYIIGDTGVWGDILIIILFLLFGFLMLDLFNIRNLSFVDKVILKDMGYVRVLFIGIIFGVGLSPCTFAFLGPILALVAKGAGVNYWKQFFLFISFALGHILVIILAGLFLGFVEKLLIWNRKTHILNYFRKFCGLFLIGTALVMIYNKLK